MQPRQCLDIIQAFTGCTEFFGIWSKPDRLVSVMTPRTQFISVLLFDFWSELKATLMLRVV